MQCFPVKIAKHLRTAFFIEHILWLLLVNIEEAFARIFINKKQLRQIE